MQGESFFEFIVEGKKFVVCEEMIKFKKRRGRQLNLPPSFIIYSLRFKNFSAARYKKQQKDIAPITIAISVNDGV